jgi:hypothetical protein
MRDDDRRGLVRCAALALLAVWSVAGCRNPETAAPVVVRDPNYLVVRPIRREPDADHTIPVDLPYSGGGQGFASATPLFDLTSFDLRRVEYAGGRTSVVGEAAIWLPLTPEGSRRLQEWSASHIGEQLGMFLKGRLVAAPVVRSAVSGGLPLAVAGKTEGDRVLRELRGGGAAE